MNYQKVLYKIITLLALLLMFVSIHDVEAGQHYHKKKKVVIHVPIHKKIEKHVHTIIKHHHHHHKPIVIKEEKKIIHESHPIIKQEEVSHEHVHQHQEEEHVHHHYNYEHKHSGEEEE